MKNLLKRWFRLRGRSEPHHELLQASAWFDADWYCSQLEAHERGSALADPVGHYLSVGAAHGLMPGPDFDAAWYLAAYPDVGQANMNPLVHFVKFGQFEGRLPRRNRALAWDFHLWRGADAAMLPRLERLLESSAGSEEEQGTARWALGRWWARHEDPAKALDYLLPPAGLSIWPRSVAPGLLALECLHRTAAPVERLREVLSILEERCPQDTNLDLARANLSLWSGAGEGACLASLNALWGRHELMPISIAPEDAPLLDRLLAAKESPVHQRDKAPLVSVIVPVFSAAGTVATAIRSLFAQSWRSLEIIVVDDASEDQTLAVLRQLESECPANITYRILPQETNQGAYVARNAGLNACTGAFITTHDADDWSHPEKLARQVQALQYPVDSARPPVACVSAWARVTPSLEFHRWRLEEEGFVHRNVSSLMFRREVIKKLGFWDEVSVNADSEYLERVRAAYGAGALAEVLPNVPLAFGRAWELSLSQHGETHLQTQFIGIRAQYMAAARRWHERAASADNFYLSAGGDVRPFPAPLGLLRREVTVTEYDERDRIEASGLFDAGWYLRRYVQLHDTRVEAFDHYWREGRFAGLDPNPGFSQSGYVSQLNDEVPLSEALSHFLDAQECGLIDRTPSGDESALAHASPMPALKGRQQAKPSATTVLLCGHQAGAHLYGAERSLIDVARGLDELGYRLVIALPEAMNRDYMHSLLALCDWLVILPYGWQQQGKPPEPATVAHFHAMIERFSIQAVALNSLVLDEPAVTAKQLGIPVAIHLRELPHADSALCETLNADASWIVEHARAQADLLIANSSFTALQFAPVPSASHIAAKGGVVNSASVTMATVPNTIEMQPLLSLPSTAPEPEEAVKVGILSSGHTKKGLADIEHLIGALAREEVRFVVFGDVDPALRSMAARLNEGKVCLELAGYVSSPAEALERVHVVLSLSRFQESFGRTALEAMAAGRPFVGYHHGALPEVVGDAGVLIEFGDTTGLARELMILKHSPERVLALRQLGRERAVERYGWAAYVNSLKEAYTGLLGR
ncbi:glycosyltransferase [Carnimonas nigrificans]|uniref:glycosyltransferase n=1 Tax=Carnimonas nigrificans TaxID=64323 RepID=UPI00046E74EB|nr:glycosyltransferase [Carnimonas nigrificans]